MQADTAKAPDPPSKELAPIGPHPSDTNRDARGRFAKANSGHLIHGAESEQHALMLAPLRQAERAQTLADLGLIETTVTRPTSYVIDGLIGAQLIAQSYLEFLAAQGGPITTKGRQRRAVDGYFKAIDRVAKFAAMLGLERVARPTTETTREWLIRSQTEQQAAPDSAASGSNATAVDGTDIEPRTEAEQ